MALSHPHEVPASRSPIDEFRANGYAIFHDVLPPDLVADLKREYLAALTAKQDRLGVRRVDYDRGQHDRYGRPVFLPLGGNHDVNRWNMHLPSRRPFLDGRVIANPRVMEIIDAIMGEDCTLAMLASDAAAPGSQLQEIHQDALVVRMAVNIPLVDFTIENGAIEMWPRTHRRDPFASDTSAYDYSEHMHSNERIAELVQKIPSVRGIMKAGSMLVRDHRLLHRGTQNTSTEVRPMLSLLYFDDAKELPFRHAIDGAARAALKAREVIRKLPASERQAKMLSRANAAGRIVEFSARSDRDYRRIIPQDIWRDLPDRAKRLLRYARVEGQTHDDAKRSLRATKDMLRIAWTGRSGDMGGKKG